jgi:hypothetical protein
MLSARTIEVIAGFSLAIGIYPQLAAVALLAFLVPPTFAGHSFWQVAGTPPLHRSSSISSRTPPWQVACCLSQPRNPSQPYCRVLRRQSVGNK